MAGTERLNALDLAWLEMQGAGPPIAMGTVCVADGPPPSDGELVQMITSRIHLMPRLQQVLEAQGHGLRRPGYRDIPDFDAAVHIRRVRAIEVGGLDVAVGEALGRPLPESRPLWDMTIVEGLPVASGKLPGWALAWRVHHSVVDGLGAMLTLGHAFDTRVEGGPTLADVLQVTVGPDPPDGERAPAAHLMADLGHAVSGVAHAVPHVPSVLTSLVPHLPGPFSGPVGPRRAWASASAELARAKAIRRAFGVTINDIVLAAVAGAFRQLLEQREQAGHPGAPPMEGGPMGGGPMGGGPVGPHGLERGRVLRTLIPVSTRPPGDRASHNKISTMLVGLPVGIPDPVERLRAVALSVEHGRAVGEPALASVLLGAVDRALPAAVQDILIETAGRTAPAWFTDTITSSLPGPQRPLFLCGRRVRRIHPVIPVAGHTCITTGVMSFDGTLCIGVTSDPEHVPDPGIVARGISDSLDELAVRAGA